MGIQNQKLILFKILNFICVFSPKGKKLLKHCSMFVQMMLMLLLEVLFILECRINMEGMRMIVLWRVYPKISKYFLFIKVNCISIPFNFKYSNYTLCVCIFLVSVIIKSIMFMFRICMFSV